MALDEKELRHLLTDVKNGSISLDKAVEDLKRMPFEDLGFASVDHHRELRKGFPEVIYAEGKTKEQVRGILLDLYEESRANLMATRASREKYEFVKEALPAAEYDEAARIIYVERQPAPYDEAHKILVLTAGTSDIPVAEEAKLTARLMGNTVESCYDVGVAGIHRLFARVPMIESANVVIVVAGMEGALASVVGGLTAKPIVAVPTSIGYGASFGGLSALLAMLNSCAAGTAVVNIDNGFGAGALASKINHMR